MVAPSSPDVHAVVQAVRAARKYRTVDPTLVAALAAEELAKGRNLKAAVKAVKNRLHQSAAAYLSPRMDYVTWLDRLAAVRSQGDEAAWRAALRDVMAAHASTRERLPILEDFYPAIFQALPPVRSILDVACGLNPLTIPWMGLPSSVTYLACDIFQDQVDFLNRFFALAGIDGQAFVCDVVHRPPSQPVDVALVLKTLPCIEQIKAGAASRLLASLQARHAVVSFPAHSLGGRNKGMPETYRERFPQLLPAGWRILHELRFPSELVFLIVRA